MPIIAGRPVELLVAAGLVAIPGLWLLLRTLIDLGDVGATLGDIGAGQFGIAAAFKESARGGFYFLLVLAMVALLALAMLAAAWRILLADVVGRGGVLVLTGVLFSQAVLGRVHQTSMILAFIAVAVSAAILWFVPAVTTTFEANRPATTKGPTSMTLAWICSWAFCTLYFLGGVLRVLGADDLGARHTVVGVLVILLAIVMTLCIPGVMAPAPMRIGATIVAGLGLVATIVIGDVGGGGLVILPLRGATATLPALAVAIVVLLWTTRDGRAYFGDKPLNLPTISVVAGPSSASEPPATSATSGHYNSQGAPASAVGGSGSAWGESTQYAQAGDRSAPAQAAQLPKAEAEDLILDAASEASVWERSGDFVKLTQMNLAVLRDVLAQEIRVGDRPSLVMPVHALDNGKTQPGFLMLLGDRLVLAWWVGLVRTRNHHVVIPFAQVSNIVHTTTAATAIKKPLARLTIHADTAHTIEFPGVYAENSPLPALAKDLIEGRVKPNFDSDESLGR